MNTELTAKEKKFVEDNARDISKTEIAFCNIVGITLSTVGTLLFAWVVAKIIQNPELLREPFSMNMLIVGPVLGIFGLLVIVFKEQQKRKAMLFAVLKKLTIGG